MRKAIYLYYATISRCKPQNTPAYLSQASICWAYFSFFRGLLFQSGQEPKFSSMFSFEILNPKATVFVEIW